MITVATLQQTNLSALKKYAEVPMYVESDRIIRCEPIANGMGGFRLEEEVIIPSFAKTFPDTEDYPFPLHGKWDVSNWGIFVAVQDDSIVGGCVVALRTPEVYMLEERTDMAVLWDIRIHSDWKRSGIGTALFLAAKEFARKQGCKLLKIETQNINVSACHFYTKQGCLLRGLNMNAYNDYPEEIQLLWYIQL